MGMIRPQGLLYYRQRAFVKRLGLRVMALGFVERGQIVEACGDIGFNK